MPTAGRAPVLRDDNGRFYLPIPEEWFRWNVFVVNVDDKMHEFTATSPGKLYIEEELASQVGNDAELFLVQMEG